MATATKVRNRISAKWTHDCQGKQDFDGSIIEISTRYWPRGGGFDTLNTVTGQWKGNEDRPDIRPHAKSSILLRHGDPDNYESTTLAESDFEADTEAEVKTKVEAWATQMYNTIAAAVKAAL